MSSNAFTYEDKFLNNVLYIDSKQNTSKKLNTLRIYSSLGNSSAFYHSESKLKSKEKYMAKPLVLHGGRSEEEIKK